MPKKVALAVLDDLSHLVDKRRVWGELVVNCRPARMAADRLSLPPQAAGVLLVETEMESMNVAAAAGKSVKGIFRDARKFLLKLINDWHPDVAPGARRQAAFDLSRTFELHPKFKP